MKISIIVPVLSFNEYSLEVIKRINEDANMYINLQFIFVCSDQSIMYKLTDLLIDFRKINSVKFYNCKNYSSNFLRKSAIDFVETDFIYYQDCDDRVNFVFLNSIAYSINIENIYCFNIERIQFNDNNKIIERRKLYRHLSNIEHDHTLQIHQLPTNIVNKIIPITKIKLVIFYNLPFTQDWSISYQLFLYANHYFIDECIYIYNNYPFSTAHISNTRLTSLKRVSVMKKIIIEMYKTQNLVEESKYINYRYNLVLQERYNSVGVNYISKYSLGSLTFIFENKILFLKVLHNIVRSHLRSVKIISLRLYRDIFKKKRCR